MKLSLSTKPIGLRRFFTKIAWIINGLFTFLWREKWSRNNSKWILHSLLVEKRLWKKLIFKKRVKEERNFYKSPWSNAKSSPLSSGSGGWSSPISPIIRRGSGSYWESWMKSILMLCTSKRYQLRKFKSWINTILGRGLLMDKVFLNLRFWILIKGVKRCEKWQKCCNRRRQRWGKKSWCRA